MNQRIEREKKSGKLLVRFLILLLALSGSLSAALSLKHIPDTIGPDGRNISRQFFQFLRSAIIKNKYDGRAEGFHKYLDRSLERFELKNLFNSEYMTKDSNGQHYVTYRGKYFPDGYKVSLETVRMKEVSTPNFGDFSAEFALKHNPNPTYGGNSYSGNLDVSTNLGPFTHKHGLNAMDSGLHYLDSNNLKAIASPDTSYFKKIKDPEARKAINDFTESYPALAKFMQYYFGMDSLLKVQHDGKIPGLTAFAFEGNIEQTLMRDYPDFGDYLDDIKYLGFIKVRLMNLQGRSLGEFAIESKSREIRFKFYTHNGKVIPYDTKGNFYPQDGFLLTSLTDFPFIAKASVEANLYGLVLENDDIQLLGRFSNTANSGVLSLKVTKIKEFDVSGAFAYFAPSWAINIFVPGNLQSIIYEFTETVVKANNGKGTSVVLRWDRDASKTLMKTQIETEFLDNFFIRFGLKIWNNRVLPDEDAKDDIRAVLSKTLELLLKGI
ncbi:hypothetical protein EHQ53_09705 [Leptospira langatensis]|uniref:Uncharacterized protein n=1 Tax=Leptospira langatensis TaxID=2484983 RepID=A0A5F1ZV60_9LEPT|nr:hypothetical protein [Leptospira langatensis]TGK00288.1 hypothetical protein EHO57_13485 [Leptospira langatensis]TGL41076.1 hypothetical protein EHQ53_09705 [Leptospira langatensis]